MGAVHNGPNALQVGIPPPIRQIVGVRDSMAELRPFPADFANPRHTTSKEKRNDNI
jgi:hypothetical protein